MEHIVTLSHAKQQLGSLVDLAHHTGEAVFLTRHGKQVAAIVNADDYTALLEKVEAYEDAHDAIETRSAIEYSEEALLPWEEVKADLGLA